MADISQKDQVECLASDIAREELEGIQLLVNNAGIARDDATEFAGNGTPDMSDAQAISKHFMRSNPSNWAEMYATNVTAVFFMSMAFLPLLTKGGRVSQGCSSSVINISSNSAFLKDTCRGHIGYAASKAG